MNKKNIYVGLCVASVLLTGCSGNSKKNSVDNPSQETTEVSSTWYQKPIEFNEKSITFPATLADIQKQGFTFVSKPSKTKLDKYESDGGLMENEKGAMIFVEYENPTKKSLKIEKASITGFSISVNDIQDANVVLPSGVHFGDTKESVVAIYGEPSNTYDAKESDEGQVSFSRVTYNQDYNDMDLTFEDNKLTDFNLRMFVEQEMD